MVNLPRPTVLPVAARLEAFPGTSSSQTVPAPPVHRRCFQFNLINLPRHESQDDAQLFIVEELLSLSRRLCIPSAFGRGDGQAWTLDEQDYPALLRWKTQQVPALLGKVSECLDRLASTDSSSSERSQDLHLDLVLGHVVCTLARFLPLTHAEPFPDADGQKADEVQETDEGWSDQNSRLHAGRIMDRLQREILPAASLRASEVARSLLVDYLKPIVQETAKSSSASISAVDANTGRKKPPAAGASLVSYLDQNLGQHRFASAADDNDASNLAPLRFAVSLDRDELEEAVGERNEALGCVNVLAWCLEHLQLEASADWDDVWPLLVPPLLTLLEHAQPRFRLRGAMLLHNLLNPTPTSATSRPGLGQKGGEGDRGEMMLGRLLMRTGIGSLFERALQVNLTYVHDATYAPGLVGCSISSLRRLILLTTHPIVWRSAEGSEISTAATSGGEGQDDCGQRRMDALCRLVSQGILSTWSYLPLPPSSTLLGRRLVRATCSAYLLLIDDLAPPDGSGLGAAARFVDVTVDWIFRTWLSTTAFETADQIAITLQAVHVAGRMLFPSETNHGTREQATRIGDGVGVGVMVGRRTTLMLSAVAKCWINACDSPLRSASPAAAWTELEACLAHLLQRLTLVDPTIEPRWGKLVELDERLAVLLNPDSSRSPDQPTA